MKNIDRFSMLALKKAETSFMYGGANDTSYETNTSKCTWKWYLLTGTEGDTTNDGDSISTC